MRQVRIILLAVLMAALITATLLLVTRRNAVLISAIGFPHPTPCNRSQGNCEGRFWGKIARRAYKNASPRGYRWGARGRLGPTYCASESHKILSLD
jgi:hypothetical protein